MTYNHNNAYYKMFFMILKHVPMTWIHHCWKGVASCMDLYPNTCSLNESFPSPPSNQLLLFSVQDTLLMRTPDLSNFKEKLPGDSSSLRKPLPQGSASKIRRLFPKWEMSERLMHNERSRWNLVWQSVAWCFHHSKKIWWIWSVGMKPRWGS